MRYIGMFGPRVRGWGTPFHPTVPSWGWGVLLGPLGPWTPFHYTVSVALDNVGPWRMRALEDVAKIAHVSSSYTPSGCAY